MKQPVTGVQLYTLRDHTKTVENFNKTLARLASEGVRDIQISAIGPDITPRQQKEALDRYNMHVCVTHQNYVRLRDALDDVISAHRTIGCDSVGLGYCPEDQRTDEDAAYAFIEAVNSIGKKLKENGQSFHYHNHDFEFAALPGSSFSLMDLLLKETDPAQVKLIADVAWIHYAGLDPAEFLRQHADRIKVVHFKDYVKAKDGSPQFISLGQGVVDLQACWQVCCEKEIPFIMYEQDNGWTNGDPFLSTEESLAYFQKLRG